MLRSLRDFLRGPTPGLHARLPVSPARTPFLIRAALSGGGERRRRERASNSNRPAEAAPLQDSFEVVIGLELHAQILASSKLFSGAAAEFAAAPNSRVALFDAAIPGTLPRVNAWCVEQAVRTAVALGCDVQERSSFERKHYSYPDLPLGYQITQRAHPIAKSGTVRFRTKAGGLERAVRIARIQLEQDSAKSVHGETATLVDLNRAGSALMEIVTEADLRSGEDAATFLREMQRLLRCIGTCDGNMEEGSLRVDANISVRRKDGEQRSAPVEVKNVNGGRYLQRAIEYEAQRQIALLVNGNAATQADRETRLWDVSRGVTVPMRSKENMPDYRFMFDGDLPHLVLPSDLVSAVRASMPELPAETEALLVSTGVSASDARILVDWPAALEYFEKLVHGCGREIAPKLAASWLCVELRGVLGPEPLSSCTVQPERLASLLHLVIDGLASGKAAKEILEAMVRGDPSSPESILENRGLRQVTDPLMIESACRATLAAMAPQAEQYRGGNTRVLGPMVADAIQRLDGRASPPLVSASLQRLLKGDP